MFNLHTVHVHFWSPSHFLVEHGRCRWLCWGSLLLPRCKYGMVAEDFPNENLRCGSLSQSLTFTTRTQHWCFLKPCWRIVGYRCLYDVMRFPILDNRRKLRNGHIRVQLVVGFGSFQDGDDSKYRALISQHFGGSFNWNHVCQFCLGYLNYKAQINRIKPRLYTSPYQQNQIEIFQQHD